MDIQASKVKYFESVLLPVKKKLYSVENEDLKFIKKPNELVEYPRYIRSLTSLVQEVSKLDVSFSTESLKAEFEKEINAQVLEFSNKQVRVNEKYESILLQKKEEFEKEARLSNAAVRQAFDSENRVYVELEEKRKTLEQYNDDIIALCSEYGITTSDVQISNSSFTLEELSSLYDQYISYMSKSSNRKNIIGTFRERIPDYKLQLTCAIIFLILTFTPLFDVCVLVILVRIFIDQLKSDDKMKSYAVLLGLLYNVRPLEMGFKSTLEDTMLEDEKVNEDEDERLSYIADEWEEELNKVEKESPDEDIKMQRINFANSIREIEEEAEKLKVSFIKDRDRVISKINNIISETQKEFEEGKKHISRLGDSISKSAVLDTRFKLGKREGVFEEVKDIGLRNIVIHPSKDEKLQRMFLQVLLANALCNCKASYISVTVYDPNKFGQDLVSFYLPDLDDLIKFENDSMANIIAELKKFASKNLKEMRGQTINEFNKESEEVGRTTKEYRLLIVLSQPKSIEEDEALTEFMSYSANLGVLIWIVTNKAIPGTTVFKTPFEGIANPYVIDEKEFGLRVATTLEKALKDEKADALFWKDFMKAAVPEDKTWTYVTDDHIDLDPGFIDGDPTQFKGYTVGNEGNVHIIGVGGTGAGKSVFINHTIATLTTKYSPRDLELWLVDFKGSEFQFYIASETFPKVLPHIKACLCTSDPDYAGSLYKAIRTESERRYAMLMDADFKNIKAFNAAVRKGILYDAYDDEGTRIFYNKVKIESTGKKFDPTGKRQLTLDEIVPRILFINDEFQVFYQKAETDVLESVNGDITYISKVSRAAGVHLAFFSQSMKGTISDDVLDQFQLRFALKCDAGVSMSVLGTNFASELKQPRGFLYVRSIDDKSKELQKKYRTPLCSDDILREHINMMADKASKENHKKKDLITYRESTKYYIQDLESVYEKYGDDVEEGTIFFGERMTYSENRAPDNVVLTPENNKHIYSVLSVTEDLVNFYKSIMVNLKCGSKGKKPLIFTNCQVKDLHYLCELDLTVPDNLKTYSDEKVDVETIIDLITAMYQTRVQNAVKDIPAYYILIGWDKAIGIGVDPEFSIASKLVTLLQLCGEYNMHFIFISSGGGKVSDNIINACSIRVCGKVDQDTSYRIIDSKVASKVTDNEDTKTGWVYIYRNGERTRAKIYRSKGNRKIKSTEFKVR